MAVGKLVVLMVGDGSFHQGFPVMVQIGEEGARATIETKGKLPPNLEIEELYGIWQSAYCNLGLRSRLHAPAAQVTNVSVIEDCYNAAQNLQANLNAWLQSEPFRPIRERLLEKLLPSDEIRLILQVDHPLLQKLPWHLLDWFDRYPKAEFALSAPVFEKLPRSVVAKPRIKILAILGNSQGIDTQADRTLLEQLPQAETTFLVEPQRKEVTDLLWEQDWDILFFAGHSASQNNGDTGRMYINQTDSLTINQLKFALRRSVDRGLKLAIFNSCDGLGLARELADLQIPDIIVMREPVPDRVAQEFLKYFLAAFSRDGSFYLAVREARERLQWLEDQFPCATWLPMICQNPAEPPLTWQELRGVAIAPEVEPIREVPPISPPAPEVPPLSRKWLLSALLAGLAVTTAIVGVRYGGLLQPLELSVYDQMMRSRPAEERDPRLLVITIDDEDIEAEQRNNPNEQLKGRSLSDRSLSKVLAILKTYQPRVVGMDIYRDFKVDPTQPQLTAQLRQMPHLIAVCKGSDAGSKTFGIAPPNEIPLSRLGFSDFVDEPDQVPRRQLLFYSPEAASKCQAPYAFSVQLAFHYLAQQGILPGFTADKHLQLGNVVFRRIQSRTSGYQGIDARGSQVLLKYRATEEVAPTVSLSDVLAGRLNPAAVRDKVVLIGVTANSSEDRWATPYTVGTKRTTPGVFVQAHMLSQILSAVLDQRPLIWVWRLSEELLWILVWAWVGAGLAVWLRSPLRLALAIGAAAGILYALCFSVLLVLSGWIPFVPAVLALCLSSSAVFIYRFTQMQQVRAVSTHSSASIPLRRHS